MLRQLLRPFVRNVNNKGSRAYHNSKEYKRATMDDLPVPQGSWQQYYDAKQKVYNMQLIAGFVIFASTLTYISTSGVIFFNWGPPTPKNEAK